MQDDRKSDFHIHLSRSSLEAMVQAAQRKGVYVLGICEHLGQMSEGRSLAGHLAQEGPLLSFAEYLSMIDAQKSLSKGQIDLRVGLEVDFLPDRQKTIEECVRPYQWDFLIGSVHELSVGDLIDGVSPHSPQEGQERWKRYFHLLRLAATSGFFDIIGHPLRMRANNPHVPLHLDEELDNLAVCAALADVALELNGHDIQLWPEGVRALIRACARYQTPVSLGSDASVPQDIARGHAWCVKELTKAGIRTLRTWKGCTSIPLAVPGFRESRGRAVTIRAFRSNDAAACLNLLQQHIPTTGANGETTSSFHDFLLALPTNPTVTYFVIEDHRAVIGCGGIETQGIDAQLRWFLIHPHWQRQGIGKRLLDLCFATLPASAIFIGCETSSAAYPFFQQQGFSVEDYTLDAFRPGLHRVFLGTVLPHEFDEIWRHRVRKNV
jgi:histidinol-phosphatase (PHP family)